MIKDLDEAKKIEEHAAEFEVAPVVTDSHVEVGAALITPGDERLKSPVTSF